MSGKVVSLNGAPTGEPYVSEVCVETLRDLLTRAEAGDLIGIAVSALHCDGLASYHVSGRVGGYSMLGALEMAKMTIIDANQVME